MKKARTSLAVLLSSLIGFTLGGAVLAFAALLIGMSLLARANGGIHSDWTLVVFFGTLVCFGLGGVAGAKGAVRLAKSWRDSEDMAPHSMTGNETSTVIRKAEQEP
jgi:hypothetical protein